MTHTKCEIEQLALKLIADAEDEADDSISTEFAVKDVESAIEGLLDEVRAETLKRLESGDWRTLARLRLYHICDMPDCTLMAINGDIFCAKHRHIEDTIILQACAENDCEF